MLLKNDEQTVKVLGVTKRKLMSLAYGAECLSSRIDNWISTNNNYRRLRTSKLSKSCLTMTDYPLIPNKSSHWCHEDSVLLENWLADNPETPSCNNNNNSFSEPSCESTMHDEKTIHLNKSDVNSTKKICKENILNPTIKMDEDFIEIEYYYDDDDLNNYENYISFDSNFSTNENAQDYMPDENRKKFVNVNCTVPKIPSYKVVTNRGLSPNNNCKKYCDFLVTHKYDDENNAVISDNKINNEENMNHKSIQVKNENTVCLSESIPNTNNDNQFDKHRTLTQATLQKYKSNLLDQQHSSTLQRGGSTRVNKSGDYENKTEIKSFFSFRCPNRINKSDRKIRKKYVTSENGAYGPIWPAVLLTYDKRISTGPPGNNTNELTMACSVVTAVSISISLGFLLPQHMIIMVLASSPASEMISSNDAQNINHGIGNRHRALPLLLSPRSSGNSQFIRARLTQIDPLISDVVIDDTDDIVDVNKRQFDDYGHMRFGKRGELEEKFDDYGHMRFGRGHV